ncbi:hypothetical protein OPT61_g887 [Boeremia exigua]|uniref:Uncharacterized protein n=1 Tax=Boeremia exigua TaxID=749465 RepID=A0ACC2ISC1_9PLEO|nr:hypothetical protein OPT61_g887 [Boeremia exigua]
MERKRLRRIAPQPQPGLGPNSQFGSATLAPENPTIDPALLATQNPAVDPALFAPQNLGIPPALPHGAGDCGDPCMFEAAGAAFGTHSEGAQAAVGQGEARRIIDPQPQRARSTPVNLSTEYIIPAHMRRPLERNRCVVCNEEYIVPRNHENSCIRHRFDRPAYDPDSPWWNHWNDRVNGKRDTPYNSVHFPEGFRWACCGRPGKAAGCTSDYHQPENADGERVAKRRYEGVFENAEGEAEEEAEKKPEEEAKKGAEKEDAEKEDVEKEAEEETKEGPEEEAKEAVVEEVAGTVMETAEEGANEDVQRTVAPQDTLLSAPSSSHLNLSGVAAYAVEPLDFATEFSFQPWDWSTPLTAGSYGRSTGFHFQPWDRSTRL